MQNSMEAASYPFIHHALPMWKSLVRNLTLLANGVAREQFKQPHDLTMVLEKRLVDKLKTIEVHGLWTATCLLHPGMRAFTLITDNEYERQT